MERHLRKSIPLQLPAPVADLLGGWRGACGATNTPELDVDRVRDVEGTMGTGLPETLLAIFCASIPALSQELGMQLGKIAEHSARVRAQRVRGDFVACAMEHDGSAFYGFLKKTADTHLGVFRRLRGRVTTIPYLEWLQEQATLRAVDLQGPATPFTPRLVLDALPEGEGQRVRHAKWGIGRVLADHGEGPTRKVKAEFPSLGLKVVQARFLEFL